MSVPDNNALTPREFVVLNESSTQLDGGAFIGEGPLIKGPMSLKGNIGLKKWINKNLNIGVFI